MYFASQWGIAFVSIMWFILKLNYESVSRKMLYDTD